jgi:hypothetical protein
MNEIREVREELKEFVEGQQRWKTSELLLDPRRSKSKVSNRSDDHRRTGGLRCG